MTEKTINFHLPLAGVDLTNAFSQQKPREIQKGLYSRTTPAAMNMRGYDAADKLTGASRPGLTKIGNQVADFLVQHLTTISYSDD